MKKCCDMKGFLSFIVLKLISKQNMSGEEVRLELENRKGHKPSPGTIYPVLKSLSENGWIQSEHIGKVKRYTITSKGKREIHDATRKFVKLFCDMKQDFHVHSKI